MSHTGSGQLRIIGGQWRGRKIPLLSDKALRPTPNRIRETLFNWLANDISGAVCFDACAGSGALGFEALSRGAKQVIMNEPNPALFNALKASAERLKASAAVFYAYQLPNLSLKLPPLDIVFLDPPFHQGLVTTICDYLISLNCLSAEALIYIEMESECSIESLKLPEGWSILKSKTAGQVGYHLLQAGPTSVAS